MKQHGRLVMRLDSVEDRLSGVVAMAGRAGGSVPAMPVVGAASGLAVGSPLDDFTLPDLDGNPVSLASLCGKRVLLVNWSNHCGFCSMIAPDLAAAQEELKSR